MVVAIAAEADGEEEEEDGDNCRVMSNLALHQMEYKGHQGFQVAAFRISFQAISPIRIRRCMRDLNSHKSKQKYVAKVLFLRKCRKC